jgi:ferrochelatase
MPTSEEKRVKSAVLLMAYGSPESVEDLEPYLLDIRGGRATSPELVEEIKARYLQIGGRSPLLDITKRQALALQEELIRRTGDSESEYRSYVGMRHWEPRIKEAVKQICSGGADLIYGLVMAPHSSRMSTGAYFARLDEAVGELGVQIPVFRIENWHTHPGLIAAIAEKAQAAIGRFGDQSPYVVFTAHSLPARILAQGDPYANQLDETAQLVAQALGLPEGRWSFSFQSAGQSSEPWLGPAIERVIPELAQAGERNILVVPIGFVCDHVEILYDIDIACQELAAKMGARLERSESLNDSPMFISTLADLVLNCHNN